LMHLQLHLAPVSRADNGTRMRRTYHSTG
jgi:hypothetical protein